MKAKVEYLVLKKENKKKSKLITTAAACLVIALFLTSLISLQFIQTFFSDIFFDEIMIALAGMHDIEVVEVLVTAPVADETPATTATSDRTSFICGAVTWDPTHDPFQSGIEYTVFITLTADREHLFANTLATATINGYNAIVSNNTGKKVTLAYQFAATKMPVTNFTAQTAFCTAANNPTHGHTFHVAAPAHADTTFTLNTATTTKTNGGTLVTNIDTVPGVLFEYTDANNMLTSSCSENKVVINIPEGFVGDVDVIVHAEKDPTKKVEFTLLIHSVEATIANAVIPTTTPWNANIHNAVFVAGDWEWRVLDKNLGAGGNKEALIISMHTKDDFMSPYYAPSSYASNYQDSTIRAHVIARYNLKPIFEWAHDYSVEPNKTTWTQIEHDKTIKETVSSGTLTKDYGAGYDGSFLLTRNDLSILARGVTSIGYNQSANQFDIAQPSRQFTKTDGSVLPDFKGHAQNAHFWSRCHYSNGTSQELNSNGGWGTGQTDARYIRYYLPAMIIRYNTQIRSVAITVDEPETGNTPSATAYSDDEGFIWSDVTWTPAHSTFLDDVPYEASITLTADDGHAFAKTLLPATINGYNATISNNTPTQVTLSYTFVNYRIEDNFGPASGGNTVTITGVNFGANKTTVTIGGNPCAITYTAPTGYYLECIVPAGTFGLADVRITDEEGVLTVIKDGYAYHPVISNLSPNHGPTTGGTGFGIDHDPDGRITISGAGFFAPAKITGIDPDYVKTHARDNWVNPKFASATTTNPLNDPFGGVITSTGIVYSSRAAYRLFDKVTNNTSYNNWQVTVKDSPSITATYTLPAGKYVNLKSITMYNGYYSPVKQVEFFAGYDVGGVSLTGVFSTTSNTIYAQYNVPVLADDIWTNKITVKIYPPAWANVGYTSIQELIYGGRSLDLTSLGLTNWPVFFTMEDITPVNSVLDVTIGGNVCEWELVSDSEILCKPPSSTLPGNGEGTVDVVLTTVLGSNVIVQDGSKNGYTYTEDTDDEVSSPDEADVEEASPDEIIDVGTSPDETDGETTNTDDTEVEEFPSDEDYDVETHVVEIEDEESSPGEAFFKDTSPGEVYYEEVSTDDADVGDNHPDDADVEEDYPVDADVEEKHPVNTGVDEFYLVEPFDEKTCRRRLRPSARADTESPVDSGTTEECYSLRES